MKINTDYIAIVFCSLSFFILGYLKGYVIGSKEARKAEREFQKSLRNLHK